MRVKYLTLSSKILLDIFTGRTRAEVVKNAVPRDARIISMGYDQFGLIHVVIESDSFPEVKDSALMEQVEHPLFRNVEAIVGEKIG